MKNVKKVKEVEPTILTPSQQALTDEINKGNAKRGKPLPADISGVAIVRSKRGGGKMSRNPNDIWGLTEGGLILYKASIMPPQLQNTHSIIIELTQGKHKGLQPTLSAVRDIWNSLYGLNVGKGKQDFDDIWDSKYSGVCHGTQSWNMPDFRKNGRAETVATITGNDDGFMATLCVVGQAA